MASVTREEVETVNEGDEPTKSMALEGVGQQLELSEQNTILTVKIERLIEAIGTKNHSLDAKLDRIAAGILQQNLTLEGHFKKAEQQSQTTATLAGLVSQLLAARA